MKNKEIDELLKNCKIWVKTDDIDYTRWFGLDELNLLLSYIEQLENIKDDATNYNDHLIQHAKYHLNLGHLKKMRKILKGDSDE